MQEIYFTYILIGFTVLVSIQAFNSHEWRSKLIFNAVKTYHGKEWYRLFSSGLIHADWMHLAMNMYVLYLFGVRTEQGYEEVIPGGRLSFVIMYSLALGASSLYTLFKHKDHPWYNALGASGATSAVIMSFILFEPNALYWNIVPFWIVGIGYIVYSHYASKNANDNIGHDAHFWGAVFGLVFPIVLNPSIITDVFLKELLQ